MALINIVGSSVGEDANPRDFQRCRPRQRILVFNFMPFSAMIGVFTHQTINLHYNKSKYFLP